MFFSYLFLLLVNDAKIVFFRRRRKYLIFFQRYFLFRRICNLPELSTSICNALIVANTKGLDKKSADTNASAVKLWKCVLCLSYRCKLLVFHYFILFYVAYIAAEVCTDAENLFSAWCKRLCIMLFFDLPQGFLSRLLKLEFKYIHIVGCFDCHVNATYGCVVFGFRV